jgi:methylenetetrahydrofolate dehydrogenase (NADP+)/methenyltetrahydrofolate cyclohydrolase
MNKRLNKIINGKKLADEIIANCKKRIDTKKIDARLVEITIGDTASSAFVVAKKDIFKKIGIRYQLIQMDKNVSEEKIISEIKACNDDDKITAIIIQLPIPKNFNMNRIRNAINAKKDVDCLTDVNRNNLLNGNECFAGCTPKGILRFLEKNKIGLKGKRIVLAGNGFLVNMPLSIILKNRGHNFIVIDRKSVNNKEKMKIADIIISATGIPHLIKKKDVKKGVIIIDAGSGKLGNKIVGDVDYGSVKEKASYITPVPGGIGPMTIAILIENVLYAYAIQKKSKL